VTTPSSQKKRRKVALDKVAIMCYPFLVEGSRNYFQRKEKGRDRPFVKINASSTCIFTLFENFSNAIVRSTYFHYPRRASEDYLLKCGKLAFNLNTDVSIA